MNRGGSWNNRPENVRSANRNRNTPDYRYDHLGFRLAFPASSAMREDRRRPERHPVPVMCGAKRAARPGCW
ncbi:SUMF1/EgtB/PvdO family nonheme iron enzyme [Desulfuromonas carbonis]